MSSGDADRVEEFANLKPEAVAVTRQRLRRGENLRRGRAGFTSTSLHIGNVRRDLLSALGRLLHVPRNLLRRSTLLLHRGSDGRRDLRQSFDGAADLLDRAHRLLRRRLDTADLLTDFAGGFRGLLGQGLDLGSHHGKAAAGLSGACRLDRGIERKQIGLSCDSVDQFDNVTDARGSFRQFADAVVVPEWETAVECLMMVGERGGDPMVPRIAMMQATEVFCSVCGRAPGPLWQALLAGA